MEQRMFITDLDGTLLRSDATVSEYSIRVLTEAVQRGLTIGYATARSIASSGKIVSAIPWNSPLIVYNGARILDPNTHEELASHMLKPQITNEVIEFGRRHGLCPFLFLMDSSGREKVYHEELNRTGDRQFHASRPGDPRFRRMNLLRCPEDADALTITYIGLYDEMASFHEEAIRLFGDAIHVHFMADRYIKEHYFLEYSHPKANKKHALLKWCELMETDPVNVTVFGDQLNDIGMFQAAGTRLAVANAHDSLKLLATGYVNANDEDGVAAYLEKRLVNALD